MKKSKNKIMKPTKVLPPLIFGFLFSLFIMSLILKATTDYSHPESYSVKNFPLLEQPDQITCGPTSCAMLIGHYGYEATVQSVSKETKTKWISYKGEDIGMTSPDYVRIALEKFNIRSKVKTGTLDQLKYYVSQNRLPIVLLRSGEKIWHYVVAIGYNDKEIFLADPAWGEVRKIKNESFLKSWGFAGDMRGNTLPTDDVISFLVLMADVQKKTMIVPDKQ